ncbi:hypothetical protein BJV82DRAFT_18346 [Fennellomyces sp. T-0311]|nr:hypothetical protein BJV82DRAFT_18346 [Fennellomyces sp. T-0311]
MIFVTAYESGPLLHGRYLHCGLFTIRTGFVCPDPAIPSYTLTTIYHQPIWQSKILSISLQVFIDTAEYHRKSFTHQAAETGYTLLIDGYANPLTSCSTAWRPHVSMTMPAPTYKNLIRFDHDPLYTLSELPSMCLFPSTALLSDQFLFLDPE